MNVTVARATARIKFRDSRSLDTAPILEAVRDRGGARRASRSTSRGKARRPNCRSDHPLVRLAADLTGQAPRTAPYGTDASELQDIAPCVILGPGTIETAHTPHECVALADLAAAVPLFAQILAAGSI